MPVPAGKKIFSLRSTPSRPRAAGMNLSLPSAAVSVSFSEDKFPLRHFVRLTFVLSLLLLSVPFKLSQTTLMATQRQASPIKSLWAANERERRRKENFRGKLRSELSGPVRLWIFPSSFRVLLAFASVQQNGFTYVISA